jgi:transcriptional regulator with XRE-family HTH domain
MDLCKQKGISGSRMCLNLGLSKSTLSDIKSGRKKGVSTITAQKIATYFGVSVGYLLGEEEKRQPIENELSAKKRDFIQKIEKMSDAQIERLEQILALVEKAD